VHFLQKTGVFYHIFQELNIYLLIIVTLDANGQDPPSLIPQMLEAVISGEYDCAAARWINSTGEPPVRSFFSCCFYAFMNSKNIYRS